MEDAEAKRGERGGGLANAPIMAALLGFPSSKETGLAAHTSISEGALTRGGRAEPKALIGSRLRLQLRGSEPAGNKPLHGWGVKVNNR
jgi:hypothetical protein